MNIVIVEMIVAVFLIAAIDWTRVRQRVALRLLLAGIRLSVVACVLGARWHPTWRPSKRAALLVLAFARVLAVR